jgi:hypothetical protein
MKFPLKVIHKNEFVLLREIKAQGEVEIKLHIFLIEIEVGCKVYATGNKLQPSAE